MLICYPRDTCKKKWIVHSGDASASLIPVMLKLFSSKDHDMAHSQKLHLSVCFTPTEFHKKARGTSKVILEVGSRVSLPDLFL